MNNKNNIYITKPSLPSLNEYLPYLQKIWDTRILTNNGPFHAEFEDKLCKYLEIPYLSLFNNGTIALLTALKVLDVIGEIITTPFTFVATANSIIWSGCKPVFVDIAQNSYNIDPYLIESAITEKTSAILPVHCYGHPCNYKHIKKIASKYNLKVIYDAAHAFNVKDNNKSILNYGDLSVLSFHATKIFHTFEGGAIVCHDIETKKRIDRFKNFGFESESSVTEIGINGKMNELSSAMGILQLEYFREANEKRRYIYEIYKHGLKDIKGIHIYNIPETTEHNYSYFPVMFDGETPGTRDLVAMKLNENDIFPRKYFHPIITKLKAFERYKSNNLSVAETVSNNILCLPIYPDLDNIIVERIISIIRNTINT